jgi:type I restriction enzyme R subunit
MPLNEADTRAQLIEPKLQAAVQTGSQITREHFCRRDHRYTASRIYLIGDEARCREPHRVDYLLRYTDAFPIAPIEAKAKSHTPDAGLEQAKRYAHDLGMPFAYATNSHANIEYLDGIQAQSNGGTGATERSGTGRRAFRGEL